MRTPADILLAVGEAGGRLESAGDKLRVLLPANCSPELKDVIRQRKSELLALLQAKSANLTPDCVPWVYIARQVLAGEFDGADRSAVESLVIGLRGITQPLFHQALARLQASRLKSATQ